MIWDVDGSSGTRVLVVGWWPTTRKDGLWRLRRRLRKNISTPRIARPTIPIESAIARIVAVRVPPVEEEEPLGLERSVADTDVVMLVGRGKVELNEVEFAIAAVLFPG